MEFIFEFILQILAELFLQLFFQLIVELGFRGLADTLQSPKDPALSTLGFLWWGMLAGGISVWAFPKSFIVSHELRTLNVIVTPIVIGMVMVFIGKLRDKNGQQLIKSDRFGYAFAFAISMSMVRFIWAK